MALVGLFFHNQLPYWRDPDQSLSNDAVNQLVNRVRDILDNDMLFLRDIIIQSKPDFLIHQGGPDRINSLYDKTYRSDRYGIDFWKAQFELPYKLKVYPQADFFNSQSNMNANYIPVILKSTTNTNMYITALLDSDKMFRSFSSLQSASFQIADESGSMLYRSSRQTPQPNIPTVKPEDGRGYVQTANEYRFYVRGETTGLTYMLDIPNETITSQLSQIKLVLLLLLLLALIISVTVSVIVSIRFYTPIQNIIRTIQRGSPQTGVVTTSEGDVLHYIDEKMKQVLKTNHDIDHAMRSQQAQLTQFAYMRKLKRIYAYPSMAAITEKPFYCLLFHLTMTPRFRELLDGEQEKAVNYIKELFHISLVETFSELVTLQVENDQILSLLFTDKEALEVWRAVERLRLVFDRDKEYCYLTVAFRPSLHKPGQFAEAYAEALGMIGRRKLSAETQVITMRAPEPPSIGFSPVQEQELFDNVQAGQAERVKTLLVRQLHRMDKEGATVEQYMAFAKDLIAKTVRLSGTAGVEIGDLLDRYSPYEEMKRCLSGNDYELLFDRFFGAVALRMIDKKEEKDPIVEFMLESIRERYHEDLSLDMLADKLGLTPSYVSRYFKDKLGVNFSDSLNEMRIKKAKELLGASNDPVRDIATRVGYMNVTSFIRMFKKGTGLTPSDFRKTENASVE
jgi:AraC-like DNA-binding protein